MPHLQAISAVKDAKAIAPEVKLTFLQQLLQILPPADSKNTEA